MSQISVISINIADSIDTDILPMEQWQYSLHRPRSAHRNWLPDPKSNRFGPDCLNRWFKRQCVTGLNQMWNWFEPFATSHWVY